MFAWLNTSRHFRSLHTQAILRIVLPLSLIIAGLVDSELYTYNRVATSLIVERHRQLADLAAASVSEGIEGYASVLETLASKQRLLSQFPDERAEAVLEAEEVLRIFDAGVLIVDEQGLVITISRGQLDFLSLRTCRQWKSSNLCRARSTHRRSAMRCMAEGTMKALYPGCRAAVRLRKTSLSGAVVGGIDLHSYFNQSLSRDLTIGKDGFAYLVDREGIIIAHPDIQQIGADYGNLPFIKRV
jgi:hypothetical protein